MKFYNIKLFLSKILFFAAFSTYLLTSESKCVLATDFKALIPCKESPIFQKRLISSTKKLENRLKFYTADSNSAIALKKEITLTKDRFNQYKAGNLLCGKDGLPRIIATGQWDHANEFIAPGILFLYIAGWIGWSGRKYIRYANSTENAFENEIIINVPIAISIMASGFSWPFNALNELITGDLLSSDEEITISPR